MGKICFLILSEIEKNNLSFCKKLKRIVRRVRNAVKVRDVGKLIKKITLYNDIDVLLLHIPYTEDDFLLFGQGMLKSLSRQTAKICAENDITEFIFPQQLNAFPNLVEGMDRFYREPYLYKCIFVNIIENICKRNDTYPSDLDVGIIKGNDGEIFFSVLKHLSVLVKFITVITPDIGQIENEISEIYEESGLSIRVTGDYRKALKNSDIIINLAESVVLTEAPRVNARAVIINYGDGSNFTSFGIENSMINGIDIKLPLEITEKLGKKVCSNCSGVKMAEAIIKRRLGIKENRIDLSDYRLVKKISDKFSSDGYNIRGFLGRYGVISLSGNKSDYKNR